MSEIKLKPCPFCGGEAIINVVLGMDCKTAMCVKCYAQVGNFDGNNAKIKAAEAWNRRADE